MDEGGRGPGLAAGGIWELRCRSLCGALQAIRCPDGQPRFDRFSFASHPFIGVHSAIKSGHPSWHRTAPSAARGNEKNCHFAEKDHAILSGSKFPEKNKLHK